jgi:hypothetical protein
VLAENPFALAIPPRPDDPEPELHLGWQWLPTDWLAYWLMQNQGINNRPEDLELPCTEIQARIDTLRWWSTNPRTKMFFESILQTKSAFDAHHNLSRWYQEFGLIIPERGYDPLVDVEVMLGKDYAMSRAKILEFWLADPVFYVADIQRFERGRHRTYAAWRCDVDSIFVWVSM